MSKMNSKREALLIEEYKEAHTPYKARSTYRKHLNALAAQLQALPNRRRMSEEQNYYVYIYLDPRKTGEYTYTLPSGKVLTLGHEPFYVGKGTGDRKNHHKREAQKLDKKARRLSIIRKLSKEGREPIIKQTSKATESMALAFEIDLIAGIGRLNTKEGPLCNVSGGGGGVSGMKHTEETKARIQAAMKKRVLSAEHRKRIGEANRGKVRTEEMKRRVSEANTGRTHTKAELAKMSKALKGRTMSQAHKDAISKATKGRVVSQHTRALLSAANSGRKVSLATRKKLSAIHKGVPKSPEHIAAVVAAKARNKLKA